MSYTTNMPLPNQSLGVTQPLVKDNFNKIDSAFTVDHVNFNLSPLGYHKVIHFQTNPINPLQVPNFGQLYTRTVAGDQQLFFKTGQGVGTAGISQLTGNSASTNGYQFLGGVLLQWGQATKKTGQPVTFTLPFDSAAYSVQCTVLQNDDSRHSINVKTVANTGFTVACRDSSGADETITFSWIAIGAKVQ